MDMTQKIQKKKLILWILIFAWMITIFMFSAQNGDESSELSQGFLRAFILRFTPDNISEDIVNMMEYIIRKCAHMTEYAILAFLIYKTIVHIEKSLVKSFIFTFLYACTDEFHQLFIAGRAGQFRDVCIDSTGALIMILIIYIINKRKDKKIGS